MNVRYIWKVICSITTLTFDDIIYFSQNYYVLHKDKFVEIKTEKWRENRLVYKPQMVTTYKMI